MDNPLSFDGSFQLSPSPQAQLNKNTCDMQGKNRTKDHVIMKEFTVEFVMGRLTLGPWPDPQPPKLANEYM